MGRWAASSARGKEGPRLSPGSCLGHWEGCVIFKAQRDPSRGAGHAGPGDQVLVLTPGLWLVSVQEAVRCLGGASAESGLELLWGGASGVNWGGRVAGEKGSRAEPHEDQRFRAGTGGGREAGKDSGSRGHGGQRGVMEAAGGIRMLWSARPTAEGCGPPLWLEAVAGWGRRQETPLQRLH